MIIVYIGGGANEIRLTPDDQLGRDDVYNYIFIICIGIIYLYYNNIYKNDNEFSRITVFYNVIVRRQGSEPITECAL